MSALQNPSKGSVLDNNLATLSRGWIVWGESSQGPESSERISADQYREVGFEDIAIDFLQARNWTATALLVRSAVSIDYWDLGPRLPRSSNAQSPAIYERTILNGPIDVPRPPSYRSGWERQESHQP